MIKQAIKTLMMGGAMMVLPLMFTSCEDILGHWEKPTPSVEEMLTNLSSALEEGALVTITYTVDGVTYTSTFKKVGDEYVEQSTTSAARALTRGGAVVKAELKYIKKTHTLNVQVFESAKVVLNAEISCADASCTTTYSSNGSSLQNAEVNSRQVQKTYETSLALEFRTTGGEELGTVYYNEGDTWQDFCKKQSANGHMVIQIIDADADDNPEVFLSNGGSWQLYKDAGCTNPVRPDDQITQDVYIKVETITYQKASWNATDKVVGYTSVSTGNFTLASSSDGDVTWSGGTYVVKDDVSIDGMLTLQGNVNLILCDGKTLTVKGFIEGDNNSLTIYGQSKGGDAGYLILKSPLANFTNLTIHSGNITINSELYDIDSELNGIHNTPLTVYGGKLSITSDNYAIETGRGNDMTVFGGEVNAISKKGIYVGDEGMGDHCILTVFGGTVAAQSGFGNPAIQGYFIAGNGISFYESDDGNTWTSVIGSSNKRYFKAE